MVSYFSIIVLIIGNIHLNNITCLCDCGHRAIVLMIGLWFSALFHPEKLCYLVLKIH